MAKFRDTVETLITARNEAQRELEQADRQMREQASRERQRHQDEMRAAKERERSAIQHLQQLSKIAVVAGAARTAISGLNIAAQVAAGDMEAAAEAAERLPFGLGGAVREARELWQTVSGTREEMERMERLAEAQERSAELRRQNEQAARQAALDHAAELLAIQRERALLEADPAEREQMQFEFGLAVNVEGLERQLEEARNQLADARREFTADEEVAAARDQIEQLTREMLRHTAAIEDLGREETAIAERAIGRRQELVEQLQRERREHQRVIDENERGVERLAQNIEQIQQRLEETRARNAAAEADRQREQEQERARLEQERERAASEVEEEIAQKRLRLIGETHQAEVRAIEAEKDQRVQAAIEAGNVELAEFERVRGQMRRMEAEAQEQRRRDIQELTEKREEAMERERQKQEQIAAARRRADRPDAPQVDQERFLTGVRETTQQQDRAMLAEIQKQNRQMDRQLREARESRRVLEEQVRILRSSPILNVEVMTEAGL